MSFQHTPHSEQGKGCRHLGTVTINGVEATLFVCGTVVKAQFSDDPDDVISEHLVKLSMTSDIFLLTAFRLYLDVRGVTQESARRGVAALESPPLQS